MLPPEDLTERWRMLRGGQAIEPPSSEIAPHISKPRAGLGLYPPTHAWSVALQQCLGCRISCGPSFVNTFPILFRWHIFLGRLWTKPCSYYPHCMKQGKWTLEKQEVRDILPASYTSLHLAAQFSFPPQRMPPCLACLLRYSAHPWSRCE